MTTQQADDIYAELFQPISQHRNLTLRHLQSNKSDRSGF